MLQSISSKEARFLRLTPLDAGSDFKKRTVRGLTASIAGESILFVLRVGSIALLARILIPEYFGLLTMVMVVTSIVERLKDLGLGNATVQRKTITHDEVSTLFWINAAGGLVMALIVAACAWPLALFYEEPRLIPMTLTLATTFVWSSLAVQHQALLNRQMKYTRLAVIQIAAEGLSLAIAIILALKGASYWALVAREGLRGVFFAAGAWICMPWIPGRPSPSAKVMTMLSFGGDVMAYNLVYHFCSSVDKILIGRFFGATVLGIYRQGTQLALLPTSQLTYPVNTVTQSMLSRLQDQPEKYRRSYSKLVTALSAAIMPLMMFLAVFPAEIILVAFGEEWVGASNVLTIIALACFIESASVTACSVTLACGKSRRFLYIGVLYSVSTAVFFMAGSPWGAEGIALGRLVCSWLLIVPYLWMCFKDTPIRVGDIVNAVARPFLSSILMGEVLYLMKDLVAFDGAFPTVLLGGVLAIPLYFGFWVLMPSGRSEIREVWGDLTGAFGQRKTTTEA